MSRSQEGSSARSDPLLCVLGSITARSADGADLYLGGKRHRELLARLIAAHGATVSTAQLEAELWPDTNARNPIAAIRTFVAELRRSLEPHRTPRTPPRLLLTNGSGYRIPLTTRVDSWEFEHYARAAGSMSWSERLDALPQALRLWRGNPYSGYEHHPWASSEVARLTELRLALVEALADARIRAGRADLAVADLTGHTSTYPDRQRAWVLLASALHHTGRTREALDTIRTARTRLVAEYGLDPSLELERTERDLLQEQVSAQFSGDRLWRNASAAFISRTGGERSRVLSSASLLRDLAVTTPQGLAAAQDARHSAVTELSDRDDLRLTADFLSRLEIPGIWAVSDDPAGSAQLVAAARTCLDRLGAEIAPAQRARLLAIIGIETRGTRGTAGIAAAHAAIELARDVHDPTALALALNAQYLQTFHSIGSAPQRRAIGAELIELSATYNMPTYQILGHLISLQTATTAADLDSADFHAARADELGTYHERDLVGFFITWYRALRSDLVGAPVDEIDDHYETAIGLVSGCGMPGVARGLEPLVRLVRRLRTRRPIDDLLDLDFGPNAPWIRPLISRAAGRDEQARNELSRAPAPPPDHLATIRWALLATAAHALGDNSTAAAAQRSLAPLQGGFVGAETGMITLGSTNSLCTT